MNLILNNNNWNWEINIIFLSQFGKLKKWNYFIINNIFIIRISFTDDNKFFYILNYFLKLKINLF